MELDIKQIKEFNELARKMLWDKLQRDYNKISVISIEELKEKGVESFKKTTEEKTMLMLLDLNYRVKKLEDLQKGERG